MVARIDNCRLIILVDFTFRDAIVLHRPRGACMLRPRYFPELIVASKRLFVELKIGGRAMSAAAPAAESTSSRSHLYKSEVRFGVVMYGGVSLAIYINGVANELYEMVCATPKVGENGEVRGTRAVYRKAALLLGNEDLREQYVAHLKGGNPDPFSDRASLVGLERTRFVVDVISGTSAGGINGAFLAKALANGQKFSPLKNLWIQEGNIESLLNDDASYNGLEYAKNDSPARSLLNSDRMYLKLLDAFQNMQTEVPPIGRGESALADEIDLYMTTTDIRGTVVPLRLFDEVAYEKRFRQVYHFQYGTSGNEFADGNAPFLAFAARCTSSFPFAFEPMTVNDAQRLCNVKQGGAAIDFNTWKSFFTGLSSDDLAGQGWRSRAFGDGGYLDNKPFSYVVEALSWRLGDLPMERKLIYVEPAPAHPETERQDFADKPDAIENAFRALNTIPQYETIREDLEAVLARNRRIERVERIVRQVESDIEMREANPLERIRLDDGKVPEWSSLDLQTMIDYHGVSFLPYHRLRIAAVTDYIAERLAICWKVDRRSDKFYALKAMARVWREAHYYESKGSAGGRTESVNKFLDDFDIKFRLRRAGFLLRKVHQLRSLAVNIAHGKDPATLSDIEKRLWSRLSKRGCELSTMDHDALVAALNCLADGLGQSMQELRETVWPPSPCPRAQPSETARATLDQILRLILGEKLDPPLEVLFSSDEKPVPVALEALPSASRLRTLQENVLARAAKLYELAKQAASLTEIQELLEGDLAALQAGYAEVVRRPFNRERPRIRDLLGNPRLEPIPDSEFGATVEIDKQVDLCGGALNGWAGESVRRFLAEYYVRFDEYDQMSFPLYYDTDTGEPATVEVIRVSPEDARGLIDERREQGDAGRQRRKLAGTFLYNFGAFLDVRWRRNDIMWGRLDGCERLLSTLFPPTGDKDADEKIDALRNGLLLEAQCAILLEEMQPQEYVLLVDRFTKALAEQTKQQKATRTEEELEAERKATEIKQAFAKLWEHLGPADAGQRDSRIAGALRTLLDEKSLVEYVRRYYEVDRKLDTEATTKTGARALTITGRILEESEKRYRAEGKRMVWVTRAGRAAQALLTVSTPGSLPRSVFRHWLVVLYLFEALIVVGAIAFSAPAARTFGLTSLGVTLALHLASLVAGDLMNSRRWWVKLIAFVLSLAVIVLAGFGAFALFNGSLGTIMCANGDDGALLLRGLCSLGSLFN